MANLKRKLSTFLLPIIFLLILAVFVSSALYLDTRHKNKLLQLEVTRLQQSQVLLMVPDEQAQAVASWMAQHPKATQALLSQVKPGEKVTLEVGPGVSSTKVEELHSEASPLALEIERNTQLSVPKFLAKIPDEQVGPRLNSIANDLSTNESDETLSNIAVTVAKGATLSVDKDGVKIISLPHGGIRVTTRDNN
ncbi:hypothetical protein [Shewanella violacea]|uniref:Membrane anchored protein in chemotaxis locus n=1 Tax=Shewanella violacea (strain JCM 10179 / CIP 106290 / LMG 19151 / DSS12) TaxID=637905 RepID=D4ZIC6_SHEVD|nr:hypothetical protein [Shewanella violacea]BAJ01425.1 conserved hypothetical protein [Shewanella violacea DSS12]